MSCNIFLTGDLHVGKSTLMNHLISRLPLARICGFRTSRYYENKKLQGFYIEDIRDLSRETDHNFIGRCVNDTYWVSIPSSFNDYGAGILENCLKERPDLIIMDELGFFENDALLFQEKVSFILDSEIPVFGVIKQKETAFLNRIRSRNDVRIYTITKENRELMYDVLLEELVNLLKPGSGEKQINAFKYEKTVQEVFAPVYALIARQIKEKTKINDGICLDVGTGTGHLGIELAKITDLTVHLLDCSPDMLSIAEQNISRFELSGRVHTLLGDVHHLPLADNSVHLVISRGSLLFWENRKLALQEIYRVLSPGGAAYIGGGFGSAELKRQINTEMQKRDVNWQKNMSKKMKKTATIDYKDMLDGLDISHTEFIHNEANMWLILKKRDEKEEKKYSCS